MTTVLYLHMRSHAPHSRHAPLLFIPGNSLRLGHSWLPVSLKNDYPALNKSLEAVIQVRDKHKCGAGAS